MLSQSFAANIFVRFCSDRLRDLCPEWLRDLCSERLRDLCSEWLRDFHPYEVIRLLVAANNGPAAACLIIMQSNTAVLHIRFLQIAQNCLCQLVSGEKVWHMTYLCEKSNNIYFFIFLDESKKIVGFFFIASHACQSSRKSALPNQKFSLYVCLSF